MGAARDVRGREIRLLDYIEGVGQPLGFYANELRRRGWKNSVIYLPRDGVAHNNISGKRYIDHWVEAKGHKAEFSFAVYDSTDRDYTPIGSFGAEMEIEFEAAGPTAGRWS